MATAAGCDRHASAGPRADTVAAKALRDKLLASEKNAATEDQASAEAAPAVGGAGWGTLSGTFKYVGTPPPPERLRIDKDQNVCTKDGQPILDNSLVVGSDGGVANIVLFARVKRVHESAKPLEKGADSQPQVFDQQRCMFLSHVSAVQVGQKMEIKNSDPIGHNTNIAPTKGDPFNQLVSAGGAVTYTPNNEESYPAPVTCNIHPWMKAYLLPRKDKYFAVTDDKGSFTIANLPAGEDVELQVWHERAAGTQGALALDMPDLKWTKKGRFTVKLDPDQVKTIAVEVPAAAFR